MLPSGSKKKMDVNQARWINNIDPRVLTFHKHFYFSYINSWKFKTLNFKNKSLKKIHTRGESIKKNLNKKWNTSLDFNWNQFTFQMTHLNWMKTTKLIKITNWKKNKKNLLFEMFSGKRKDDISYKCFSELNPMEIIMGI